MIPQIKSVFIVMLLLWPILTPAQEQEPGREKALADSLQKVYTRQLDNRLYRLENSLLQRVGEQQEMIDSLVSMSLMLEREISELETSQQEMQLQQEETEQRAIMNKHIIFGEKEQFRRILSIAGPSLLGLILISTVLFFVLFMRQAEQTDRKIMALRKYTHNEVDETKNELLMRFKKRIRKLRERMEQRMEKKGQKGKKGKKSRQVAETKKSKRNRKK
ncbi:MAG: hypothetical protein LC655_08125 [Bacteroidales bacterium]|nr:hypothetical protein [Bacteroidales bacterium]